MNENLSVEFNEFDAIVSNHSESPSVEQTEQVSYMPKKIPPLSNINIGNIYSGLLVKGLEDGNSPFLPKNGAVDLKPAYNLYNNSLHRNVAQIEFQLDAAQKGYKEMGYVSLDTILKAREAALNAGTTCGYKKGEKPVTTFIQPRDEFGNPEKEKAIQWYNIEQIENPEFLKSFCKEKMKENTLRKNAYIEQEKALGNEKYQNYQNAIDNSERDMNAPNTKALKFSGQTCTEYMGQILAAMSSGHKLLVDEQTAKNMASKMVKTITTEKTNDKGWKVPQGIIFNQFIASANEKCKISLKMLHDEKLMAKSQDYIKNQKQHKRPEPSYDRGR